MITMSDPFKDRSVEPPLVDMGENEPEIRRCEECNKRIMEGHDLCGVCAEKVAKNV